MPTTGSPLADFPPRRWHLLVAAACVLAIYLAGVTNEWWPTPDSGLYQGLGRSLIRGEGFRFNGSPQTTVAPGFPAIVGALGAIFGEGFWAPNLFVALCGLGSLGLAYLTLARQTDRRTAFAVVLTVALCYRHYHYAHLILTDVPFSLLFWTTAYCCLRAVQGRWAWALAVVPLAAAGVAIRAPGLLLLGPLAFGVALNRSPQAKVSKRLGVAAILLATLAAMAVCFLLLAQALFDRAPAYLSVAAKHATPAAQLLDLAVGLYRLPAVVARVLVGESSLAPVGAFFLLLAVLGAWRLWREGKRLASTTCLINFVAVCVLVGHRFLLARYLVALYPMMLLLVFCGLSWGLEWLLGRRGRPAPPVVRLRAATVLAGLIIAANAPKILRDGLYYPYAAHTGRYYEVMRGGQFVDLHPVAAFLHRRCGPNTVVATRGDRAAMLHFLSRCRTVRFHKTACRTRADATAVYRDLLARPEIDVIVNDTGGLEKRFAYRLAALLDTTPGIDVLFKGKTCTIYQHQAGRPASRPAPPTTSTRPAGQ